MWVVALLVGASCGFGKSLSAQQPVDDAPVTPDDASPGGRPTMMMPDARRADANERTALIVRSIA